MKSTALAVAFLASIFLASVSSAQNTSTSRQAEACGPMNVDFSVKLSDAAPADQEADPSKALIYVVEDQKFRAVRAATVRVGVDGSWMGATRGNSYLSLSVVPGDHHLCVDWVSSWLPTGRTVALYGFTAEAGKAYYFRARTTATAPALGDHQINEGAMLNLDLVNVDEGKMLVASAQLAVSHPKR